MRRLILIVLFFSFFTTKAQKPIEEVEKEILTIGVGPQLNSFFGDIGSNSIIDSNIIIGNNCIIGANSFINKNVKSGSKVFGTPGLKQTLKN